MTNRWLLSAWHANKYLDLAESGAVILILHVNGFKISERTIFSIMDNRELVSLFSGYGYQVTVVETLDKIDKELHTALEWALAEIKKIKEPARRGELLAKPRWPMIVLRTPKGWSSPKEVDGKIIKGSYASHQVPVAKTKSDEGHLRILQEWLKGYNADELLPNSRPTERLLGVLPKENGRRLGQKSIAHDAHQALTLPPWEKFTVNKAHHHSSMQ